MHQAMPSDNTGAGCLGNALAVAVQTALLGGDSAVRKAIDAIQVLQCRYMANRKISKGPARQNVK